MKRKKWKIVLIVLIILIVLASFASDFFTGHDDTFYLIQYTRRSHLK